MGIIEQYKNNTLIIYGESNRNLIKYFEELKELMQQRRLTITEEQFFCELNNELVFRGVKPIL